MFLWGSSLGDFGQVLAFVNLFVDVESAVACAVLCDVWVAVVAGANDVAVEFEVA